MFQKRFIVAAIVLLFSSIPNFSQAEKALTNADIVSMVEAGMPENKIILVIGNAPSNFDTSMNGMNALRDRSVTTKILDAMVQSQRKESSAVAAPQKKNETKNSSAPKASAFDFNFELISCMGSGGDSVLCSFTVVNKDTIDRDLHIYNNSRMIDEFGNEYPVASRSLGKESYEGEFLFAKMVAMIPEVNVMATVKFVKVKSSAKTIRALRISCIGGDKKFNIDFHDIPIGDPTSTFSGNSASSELQLGLKQFNAGSLSESYLNLSKALSSGARVPFAIKHRHSGINFGADSDLCAGVLFLSKDFLEFQTSNAVTFLRKYPFHDFKVPLSKLKNITVSPEKWGKLSMRASIAKKDGKEEEKEFNFFSNEASLINISKLQNGAYYEVECSRICINKADFIKRLLDEMIGSSMAHP